MSRPPAAGSTVNCRPASTLARICQRRASGSFSSTRATWPTMSTSASCPGAGLPGAAGIALEMWFQPERTSRSPWSLVLVLDTLGRLARETEDLDGALAHHRGRPWAQGTRVCRVILST